MTSRHPTCAGERGIALVVALLVLLVLSLLAVVMMVSVNVDTKITSHGLREREALNNAEAGVGEALSRLRNGDITLNTSNPRSVAQIFNVAAGSVPALGTDSTALATAQPSGEWLDYSTATRGPNVLTVSFLTDSARSKLFRYDSTKDPPIQPTSGYPVYVITSTGKAGGHLRKVRALIYQKPVPVSVKGALMANVGVHTKGTFDACGLNHSANVPPGDNGDDYHTGAGDLAGIWSTSDITHQGVSKSVGDPNDLANQNPGPYSGPNGFYEGPWEVFGMTQAQFFSWVGPPVASVPDPANGVYYVNQSLPYHGGGGTGFLYVEGDLTLNAGFTYVGVIYVKGNVQINGHAWILGALICENTVDISLANGTAAILYSSDAIQQALGTAAGTFVRLGWRELP